MFETSKLPTEQRTVTGNPVSFNTHYALPLDACKVSCIACGMCEKTCTKDAIKVTGNIAVMDFEKCDDCGDCAAKCPRKCIS